MMEIKDKDRDHDQKESHLKNNKNLIAISDNDEQQDKENIKNDSQVFSYTANWLIYALGFASRPQYKFRIGIGSFLEETENEVEIIRLDENQGQFVKEMSFEHKYPPTKLMFIPDISSGDVSDILATSGESLKIWELPESSTDLMQIKGRPKLKCDLINSNDFSAPLTSFDWNCDALNLIGTSSIDTTCTIWDIEKETVYTQLIAHDKEVYDISFSPDRNIFASVGADGSARQFDLRQLEHSTVLFETENNRPLLKLGWNRLDPHYVAVLAMDQHQITLLDTRNPLQSVCKLNNHKDCVNALTWAPQSSTHICTVADDCQALIWDLTEMKPEMTDPLLEYKADEEISNLAWSLLQYEWLTICFNKNLQILKV